MSGVDLTVYIVGTLVFIAWLFGMVSWLKKGARIPRHVHLIALSTTCLGTGCFIGLTVAGMASLQMAGILLLLPPVMSYLGWLWLFGPQFNEPV